MKLFGRKSAGRVESRPDLSRPALARALTWGAAELPRSYEAQVLSAYRDNPVAQRAVRMVAEGVGGAPLLCSDDGARALVVTTTAGQSLLETVSSQLLLHGNAYIQIARDGGGRPAALFALRPERVKIEGDARGWPCVFVYSVGGAATRFGADAIIHIKAMNPLDDLYGAGAWNKALLDNAARPSGALVYDPPEAGATLSNDQFERLRAELESSFSGALNAGRPMLLEGGLKWQSLSLSPADLDFLGLKAAAARDIALAFGVPPVLLGLPGDATYANYREANRALWRQTILPIAGKILAALVQGLAGSFPGLSLSVDLDHVGELAEDRERLWSALSRADFLTGQEKRAMVGLTGEK